MKIYYVDSFTNQPFKGNPAAVVLLDNLLSDKLLQSIASEIGFSETAFLLKKDEGNIILRWFSPQTEVGLCGHATLASAKMYFEYINPQANSVNFITKYGKLTCSQKDDLISMKFPKDKLVKFDIYSEIKSFFNFPIERSIFFSEKNNYLVLLVSNELDLKKIEINLEKIFALNNFLTNIRGLILSNYQENIVKMRFFDPWEGIPEDPVTGSAGLVVSEYWFKALNRDSIELEQVSKRGGNMTLIDKIESVSIEGQAIIILEGKLMVGKNG